MFIFLTMLKSIGEITGILDGDLSISFNKSEHLVHQIQSLVLVSCEIKLQMRI